MGKLENDCVVLLMYLLKNPDADQNIWSLAEATGMESSRLYEIIYYPWLRNRVYLYNVWALEKYAEKYELAIKVMHGVNGKHLEVEKL